MNCAASMGSDGPASRRASLDSGVAWSHKGSRSTGDRVVAPSPPRGAASVPMVSLLRLLLLVLLLLSWLLWLLLLWPNLWDVAPTVDADPSSMGAFAGAAGR